MNTQANHTRGPWKDIAIDPKGNEHRASRKVFAERSSTYVLVAGNNQVADARLIAAAPELLEACKGLIHVLNNDPNDDPVRQKAVRALLEWSSVALAVEDARAAIALAESGKGAQGSLE